MSILADPPLQDDLAISLGIFVVGTSISKLTRLPCRAFTSYPRQALKEVRNIVN